MYVITRGTKLHFKMRVPSDLRHLIGREFIQRALNTSSKREARRRAQHSAMALQSAFQDLRLKQLAGMPEPMLLEAVKGKFGFQPSQLEASSELLSSLITAYVDDARKRVDERTLINMQFAYDLLTWIVRDKRLDTLARGDIRRFRDCLLKLPPRALRFAKTGTVEQAIALGLDPMHPKTVNKNVQFVSAMLSWAEREGVITANPARGLSVPLNRKASSERKAFDADSLETLMSWLAGNAEGAAQRWVPIIAYLSGMRVEEICQLRAVDIQQIDGVWVFRVTPEAGNLKTASSERLVPLHPWLIERGLLRYLDELTSERLWPEFKQDRFGKFSMSFTKWFGRAKRRAGIHDPKLTFHSLRHTFVNELKQQGVEESVIAQLVGHTNGSITFGRYGKDYQLGILATAVAQISVQPLG